MLPSMTAPPPPIIVQPPPLQQPPPPGLHTATTFPPVPAPPQVRDAWDEFLERKEKVRVHRGNAYVSDKLSRVRADSCYTRETRKYERRRIRRLQGNEMATEAERDETLSNIPSSDAASIERFCFRKLW
uniref:Uncharacterized protein n=1 Tax=Parascaris equorum TaxID=6256 RepID=A0A914RZ47_PAREQ